MKNGADLARRAHLRWEVVDGLLKNKKREYDMTVLAHLCSTLRLQPENVMEYLPPEAIRLQNDTPQEFDFFPPAFHLAEEPPLNSPNGWGTVRLLLEDRIRERAETWLKGIGAKADAHLTNLQIGEKIGLHNEETVAQWRRSFPRRYSRALLARACYHLHLTSISELFRYVPAQERISRGSSTQKNVQMIRDEWDGPVYGEVGVLLNDGERVECHCCGKWYGNLGNHVLRTHGLSPDTYRAIFGLRQKTGLIGPNTKQHRQRNLEHLPPATSETTPLTALSREQRSEVASRPRRLEMRLDPANRRAWKQRGEKYTSPQQKQRHADGRLSLTDLQGTAQQSLQGMRSDPQRYAEWRQRVVAGRMSFQSNPVLKEQWRAKLSFSRGGKVLRPCASCSNSFETIQSSKRKFCTRSCYREFLREHAKVYGVPSQRPGVGAKISASKQDTYRGSANPRAKLLEEDVLIIRRRHEEGERAAQLAREYRVGQSTIKDILNGKTWTHIGSSPVTNTEAVVTSETSE